MRIFRGKGNVIGLDKQMDEPGGEAGRVAANVKPIVIGSVAEFVNLGVRIWFFSGKQYILPGKCVLPGMLSFRSSNASIRFKLLYWYYSRAVNPLQDSE